CVVSDRAGGQADAIDGNTRAEAQIIEDSAASDTDRPEITGVADFDDFANFLNDSCEHMRSGEDPVLKEWSPNLAAGSPPITSRCPHHRWPELRGPRGF